MPKIFTSSSQKTGEIGENIAVRFLMKQSFTILERNYTKKWGEIDIIVEKDKKIHFVEVKSVSSANAKALADRHEKVSGETEDYRPEDNMHPWKQKRLARTVQTYLLSHNLDDRDWQFDLLVVFLSLKDKKARVRVVSDIVL